MSRGRAPFVAALAVGAALTLAACGPAPWDEPGASASAPASPTPSVSPSAPAPDPVPNDLSSGTTTRELTAGAVTASIDYWSTLSMDAWTAGALKPLSLSLTTTVTPSDGQQVYLQSATLTAVPGDGERTFDALEPQTDRAVTPPGYIVLDPYSYSQTFNIGAVPAAARFVTLQLQYEFLVQATPTSSEYAKQSGTDTLVVAIAAAPEG